MACRAAGAANLPHFLTCIRPSLSVRALKAVAAPTTCTLCHPAKRGQGRGLQANNPTVALSHRACK